MNKTPLVSIIIVNWNGLEYLETCLKSISSQTYKNTEVIFVDNASSDQSVAFVKKNFPQTIVIRNKQNSGFASGNNIGVKIAKGEYVLLLNTDTRLTRTCITRLLAAFKEHPKASSVQPKLLLMDEPDLTDTCGSYLTTLGYLYHFGYRKLQSRSKYNKEKVFFSNKGACMMIRKELIDKIGLFDETFWCYYEETDFCHRAWLHGYESWYTPTAITYHKDGGSQRKVNWRKIYFHNHKNKIRSMLKNFEFTSILRFLLPYLIISTVYEIFIMIFQKKWNVIFALPLAILWNIIHLPETLVFRTKIQDNRTQSDRVILRKVMRNPKLRYFYPWVGAARYEDS